MVHRADEMHMFRILTRFIGVILWSSGDIEIICYFGYKVLSKVVWEGGEIKLQSYWSKSRRDVTMTICRFSFLISILDGRQIGIKTKEYFKANNNCKLSAIMYLVLFMSRNKEVWCSYICVSFNRNWFGKQIKLS